MQITCLCRFQGETGALCIHLHCASHRVFHPRLQKKNLPSKKKCSCSRDSCRCSRCSAWLCSLPQDNVPRSTESLAHVPPSSRGRGWCPGCSCRLDSLFPFCFLPSPSLQCQLCEQKELQLCSRGAEVQIFAAELLGILSAHPVSPTAGAQGS